MLRLTMILLCFILAAAAAGRYQAEAAVRETRLELKRIERAKAEELTSIQLLRAEVAYLESPERLAAIAQRVTDLEPLSGAQLMTAEDFAIAFDGEAAPAPTNAAAADRRSLEVAALDPIAAQ